MVNLTPAKEPLGQRRVKRDVRIVSSIGSILSGVIGGMEEAIVKTNSIREATTHEESIPKCRQERTVSGGWH